MNNKINTVAVLGAGAIGAYVLYGLNEHFKENLWVIAEGERGKRLKEEGLIINDVPYFPNVKTPEETHGVDLLIVSVKYGALRDVLPLIRQAADEHTTVLSLLNGVDSEEIIAEVIPEEQIIPALIRIASTHKGNHITFPLPKENMGIIYGLPEAANALSDGGRNETTEKDKDQNDTADKVINELSGKVSGDTVNNNRQKRLLAVKACFENSRLESHESHDIQKDIWLKFALNISQNIPQAILAAGVGIYTESEHAAFLCKALRSEVADLADSYGIDIHVPDDLVTPKNTGVPKKARYSTLQDLDAKRPTEIDMFCGTVMRLAAQQQISVPYNTFAYHVIKGLEEKNEGKFDF